MDDELEVAENDSPTVNGDGDVEDEAQTDEAIPTVAYDVTSFGSDPEVEGLVNRIGRGDIVIPAFQRDYVWRQPEASKFIESLLLGLPVPGIFFARDPVTSQQLVIDGQQRLKTLKFFYDGVFNPRPGDRIQKIFHLIKVQEPFEGKTYKTLDRDAKIRLDTAVIHATTVKQNGPEGDDTSLYHIFERLNSGGRRLTHQEIRVALYHGRLTELVKDLNQLETWRSLFGALHPRLKDQELILRFLALYETLEAYDRPLSEFLNKYAGKNRNPSAERLLTLSTLFKSVVNIFNGSIGPRAFRPSSTLNVAVFDSCMVGMAHRIANNPNRLPDFNRVKSSYIGLFQDRGYVEATSRSTADTAFVKRRIMKAIDAFAGC